MADFSKMDTATIMQGTDPDGVRYLQKFLTEYQRIFGGTLNPSCPKCLADYLKNYKIKMAEKQLNPGNSGYRLYKKYENIPLEFGSPVLVNNLNLTDEYARVLLARPNGERYFEQQPALVEAKSEKKAKPVRLKKEVKPEIPFENNETITSAFASKESRQEPAKTIGALHFPGNDVEMLQPED